MKKSNKTLVAGPWVGEFGWELFVWQAYVRSMSMLFDKTVVICRQSSKDLYSDHTDQFVFVSPDTGLADAWFMHNLSTDALLKKTILENKEMISGGISILTPRRIGMPPATPCTTPLQLRGAFVDPTYIQFGKDTDSDYDYIFHMRNRKLRAEDNWSFENWKKLQSLLGSDKIACVGTKAESMHLPGTVDLRNQSLSKVFDVLRNAKCTFGPSSGPMHLSSLCGCPHVVWSTDANYLRYTNTWNPLETPILFLGEHSWHPTPEYVYEKYKEWSDD